MWGRLFGRTARRREIQFCEGCGQVCTAECRSRARMDRVRTDVALQSFPR